MNNVDTAYAELYEILNLMNVKYTEKIPSKFKEFLLREKDENYINKIDINKPLEEQDLQRKTLILLAILRLNYWCENEEEKKAFLQELNENQIEQIEKYSADNIFSNNSHDDNKEKTQLVEYKEINIIQRVIYKIKSFFRRK